MLFPLVVLITLNSDAGAALRLVVQQLPAFIGASTNVRIWYVPCATTLPLLAVAAAVVVPIFGLIAFF